MDFIWWRLNRYFLCCLVLWYDVAWLLNSFMKWVLFVWWDMSIFLFYESAISWSYPSLLVTSEIMKELLSFLWLHSFFSFYRYCRERWIPQEQVIRWHHCMWVIFIQKWQKLCCSRSSHQQDQYYPSEFVVTLWHVGLSATHMSTFSSQLMVSILS